MRWGPPGADGIRRSLDGCRAVSIPFGKYPHVETAEQVRRRERGL